MLTERNMNIWIVNMLMSWWANLFNEINGLTFIVAISCVFCNLYLTETKPRLKNEKRLFKF